MEPNNDTPIPTTDEPNVQPVPEATPVNPNLQPAATPPPVFSPEPTVVQPYVSPVGPSEQPPVNLGSQTTSPVSVFGTTPQPATSEPQPTFAQLDANPIENQPKKSHMKLFVILGVILIALAGIGVAVWLLFFNGISLKQYSNSEYSIMVPESYKKEGLDSYAKFSKPEPTDGKIKGRESIVIVKVIDIPNDLRGEIVKYINDNFTKEKITDKGAFGDNSGASDVSVVKSTTDGMNILIISGNSLDYEKVVDGKFKMKIIIAKKKAYSILVGANPSDSGLLASADRIIDSFKIK